MSSLARPVGVATAAAAGRLAALDGLRAIAVLSVFGNHLYGLFFPFGNAGRFGVFLFFLISGYCIALSLEGLGPLPVREFILRRVFRLYPVYWLSLAAAIAVFAGPFPARQILANATMLQTALAADNIVGAYWTLFVELGFYGLVAMLLALAGRRRYLPAFLAAWAGLTAAALVAAVTRHQLHLPFTPFLFLSLFAMGGAIQGIHRRDGAIGAGWLWLAQGYLAVVGLISLLIYGGGQIGDETALSNTGNYVLAVEVFLLVLVGDGLRWRWLGYIGGISYSIYLFHAIVIFACRGALGDTLAADAASMVVTLVLAGLVARLVEVPFTALGRDLARTWLRPSYGSPPSM